MRSVARASETAPLTASVVLKEAADGILPGLMGRPSAPAYALDAKVGLRGDALTGDLSLTSSGAARFDGQFMMSPAGAGQRLTVKGNGDLAELVPPAYASLLAGPIAVAVDATWTAVQGETLPHIVLRQGQIATDSLHASASGTLAGDATDLSLAVKVADPSGAPVALPFLGAGAEMKSLSLTGKGRPSGNAIRLELVGHAVGLQANDVLVPGVGLSLAVEAHPDDALGGGTLPFGLRVEADAIETPSGRLAASAGAPLLLTADGTFDPASGAATTQLRLAVPGGTVAFDGTAAADAVTGRATVDFSDIAPLSPLAGRALAGAITATIDGTFVGDAPAVTVKGQATDLAAGDPRLARLLAGTTAFSATVRGQSGGGFAVNDLVVDGTGLAAHGGATFAADTIDVQLDGSLPDLGRLADKSAGAATFTLHASGAIARPDIEAGVTVAKGRLLDQPVRDARVTVKGAPADNGWRAALSLAGSLAGGKLAGTAIATVDGDSGALAFPQVDLAVGNNRITGAVEGTAAGLFSGSLALDAPDLQTLAALALVPASGKGQASIRLQPDAGGQSVAVRFKGSGIAYQDIAVGGLDGTVTIADAFGALRVRGDASATAVVVGGRRLDTVQAKATVEGGATRIEAAAKGPDIDLSSVLHLADAAITVDTLKGTAFGAPVSLQKPVTIALDGGTTRIGDATLTLGGGSLRVAGNIAPRLDMTVVATGIAATVVNGFAPDLGAAGSVSGRVAITGDAGRAVNRLAGGLDRLRARRNPRRRPAGAGHQGERQEHPCGLHRRRQALRRRARAHCRRQGAVQRRRPRLEGQRHRALVAAGAPLRTASSGLPAMPGSTSPSAVRSPRRQ